MRGVNLIVLHCSDSPNGKHFSIEDIDDWHQERGFLRNEQAVKSFNSSIHYCGYHYIIYVDGSIHAGRAESEVGAHAQGYNAKSLGICMVGRDKFTDPQWKALNALLSVKLSDYPNAKIKGHYQLDAHGKSCPNFPLDVFLSGDMLPVEGHIYV